MADIYKSDEAMLLDYKVLPQEYKIKAAKYIKNLRRLQKAEIAMELELHDKKMQIMPDADDNIHCNFCGKALDAVSRLIVANALSQTVYICDECVRLCNEIIDEATTQNHSK